MKYLAAVFVLVACKAKSGLAPTPSPRIVAAVDATVVIDAAAAASKLALTHDGIGSLQRFAWSKQDENATAELIQKALAPALPGIATKFDVIDVPGEVEREEGYWSVKRGDKELVQVLRTANDGPAAMIAWTPEILTADGTKVGDTVATLVAKHPALACAADPRNLIADTVAASATCSDKGEPGIVYVLDASKRKFTRGPLAPGKLADIPLIAIAALPH
jgi:hypothetical protein